MSVSYVCFLMVIKYSILLITLNSKFLHSLPFPPPKKKKMEDEIGKHGRNINLWLSAIQCKQLRSNIRIHERKIKRVFLARFGMIANSHNYQNEEKCCGYCCLHHGTINNEKLFLK